MSEPKLISPMLDNFAIGGAISEHHGVSCYPAMERSFNDKYIVKVISVPASQTQLDALLLTGAYSSLDAALGYFKEVADGIADEVRILDRLSQLEGYLPYRACQCEFKEDGNGYDVYLLSPYRRTLTRQFTRQPLTHLDVLNLGLDMCSALSVCRKAGFLYVDLKPNNIYVTTDKRFFIGDLGFIRMDSLLYASLPDKYRSEYTAPEIADAFSSLNTTLDIYALGLILYQAYNNGVLPVAGENGAIPAPEYADYEMSEIILKAIAVDPNERLQTPEQMGQALVSYMQRNGANDTQIIPSVSADFSPATESVEVETTSEKVDNLIEEESIDSPELIPIEDTPDVEAPPEQDKDIIEDTDVIEEDDGTDIVEEDEVVDTEDTASNKEEESITDAEESTENISDVFTDEDYINLSFLDDNELSESDLNIAYSEVSDEVSDILAQADALASLEVPEPVIAPEPIEIPSPEPVVIEEIVLEKVEINEDVPAQNDTTEEITASAEDAVSEEDAVFDVPVKKKSRWLGVVIVIALIAGLLAGAYYYYNNYYLQTIKSVSVSGSENSITVNVDTTTDNSILTVLCADPHGNILSAPLENGKSVLTDLLPNTAYSISVQIEGFHKLLGNTTATYSTPAQTNIVQISAVTGSEDGSVILGFTVEGPDSDNWSVSYSAEGEETELASFQGHTVALNGLSVGKEYTFTLIPETELYITGDNEFQYVVSNLIYAQNLKIVSCMDNTLTATWSAPEDTSVTAWTVRCNGENYSQSITTEETVAVFEGLDHSGSYTVEVIAAGMSVSQRVQLAANSTTITDFVVDDTTAGQLLLSWNSSSDAPVDGWIVQATVNGSDFYPPMISSDGTAILENPLPNAQYVFTISDLEETQYLGVPVSYQSAEATLYTCDYDGYSITGEDISFLMCRRPTSSNWNRYSLHEDDYTNTFTVGEEASFLMHMEKAYGNSLDDITTTYMICDDLGNPVIIESETAVWNNMWYRYYGELDIPSIPSIPGNYVISVYFNGALVNTQNFTVVE